VSESSIVTEALKYYLPVIEEGLKVEFELWDAWSDDALVSFESEMEELG